MTKIRVLLVLGAMLGLALAGTGCRSASANSRPDVDALAFVEIHGHEPLEVARAVSEVFREAAFRPAPLAPNKVMKLVFEKEATMTDSIMYGAWSGKVWYRVKISIETPDPNLHLVKCDAYRVVDHGDPRFEEETKISFGKGPYQELLDKVKARLGN